MCWAWGACARERDECSGELSQRQRFPWLCSAFSLLAAELAGRSSLLRGSHKTRSSRSASRALFCAHLPFALGRLSGVARRQVDWRWRIRFGAHQWRRGRTLPTSQSRTGRGRVPMKPVVAERTRLGVDGLWQGSLSRRGPHSKGQVTGAHTLSHAHTGWPTQGPATWARLGRIHLHATGDVGYRVKSWRRRGPSLCNRRVLLVQPPCYRSSLPASVTRRRAHEFTERTESRTWKSSWAPVLRPMHPRNRCGRLPPPASRLPFPQPALPAPSRRGVGAGRGVDAQSAVVVCQAKAVTQGITPRWCDECSGHSAHSCDISFLHSFSPRR